MADLSFLFDHCAEWARQTDERIGSGGIYIFGSTIHRDGDQFIEQESDIDLVVVFPRTAASAPAMVEWLERLAIEKHRLELSLIPVLRRFDAGSPMVSVVAVTEHDMWADIHKSGARDFFRGNVFKNLLDLNAPVGPLIHGEPAPIPDLARQAVESAQELRNDYLGVSAANTTALQPWDGSDPVPKGIMRNTALVRAGSGSDPERFDVQIGLDQLSNHLFGLRDSHPTYRDLHDLISVRRGGRGKKRPISPESQLLLSETLFDVCSLGDLVVPSGAPTARPAPSVEPAGHEPSLIPTSLVIRADGRLAGRADEIRATLEEATLNAKWRRHPAFNVQMQELIEIEGKIAEIEGDESRFSW